MKQSLLLQNADADGGTQISVFTYSQQEGPYYPENTCSQFGDIAPFLLAPGQLGGGSGKELHCLLYQLHLFLDRRNLVIGTHPGLNIVTHRMWGCL